MDNDMHDDGLVHSHGWATEPPPSIGELLRPVDGDQPAVAAAQPDDRHDDGLVHGHGWAREHGARR